MSKPRERGIMFSSEFIPWIVAGRKVQTLRPKTSDVCPFGDIHDLLWVKERVVYDGSSQGGMFQWFEYQSPRQKRFFTPSEIAGFKRPKKGQSFGQAMPKSLARIWLEIVYSIHTIRLHDVTLFDGLDEGFQIEEQYRDIDFRKKANKFRLGSPVRALADTWRRLYRHTAADWDRNPDVWRIKFKLHERSVLK